MVLDPHVPLSGRAGLLVSALQSTDGAAAVGFAAALLGKMGPAAAVAELEQLKAQYAAAVRELEQGGVRPATLVGPADTNLPGPKPRVQVVTPDGQQRFPFVHADISTEQLEPGGTVFLDAKGAMVLGIGRLPPAAGAQATFVRRLPDSSHVEVSLREEKFSFYASRRVLDAIDSGAVKRGDRLLICPQQQFAFDAIPADDDRRLSLRRLREIARRSAGTRHR